MVKEKKYQITKEQCQSVIDKSPVVCSQCGGVISPIETVDNSDNPTFWSGCVACSIFESGVSKEIYLIAKEMVEVHNHTHYCTINGRYGSLAEQDYFFKSQIGGTARFLRQVFHVQKSIQATVNNLESAEQDKAMEAGEG